MYLHHFAWTNVGIRHKKQDAASIWQDMTRLVVVPLPDTLHSSIISTMFTNAVARCHTVWSLHLVYWDDLNSSSTTRIAMDHIRSDLNDQVQLSLLPCSRNSVSLIPHEALGPRELGWTSKGRGLVPFAETDQRLRSDILRHTFDIWHAAAVCIHHPQNIRKREREI